VSGEHVSPRWAHWRNDIDLVEYHGRWARMEAEGRASHGEADLIESLRPSSVLDAGCGMGRVAIELDRRGIAVQGADLDPDLLAYAQADAPHLDWHLADLAAMRLADCFDLVAMPGNVMIFCRPDDRARIIHNLAAHLLPGGLLVAGFALERRADAITLDEYDAACAAAGLSLEARFATWEREPYGGGDYAVSVHRITS
jgi:SAM-dependent methyltransferase